ncbi:hypothetical protein GIB67_025069 [Kingdonia uniflora]|uniref:Uncharacterized protein n=1 Tax=Kingdonia uniflora TaxID=39325 RepID=A0A7J7N7T5_9MAGN|nr:hypothetical protein GIB67_025069 [Kingdonia uniflora]
MFNSHAFTLEAKHVAKWDNEVDQLQFSYNGEALEIPEGHLSEWKSPKLDLIVERTSNKNSVTVTLPEVAEISINVVPVTEQDDKFRFFGISPEVEGVLGRTYRPAFKNPAKPGVAMAVVGGEDKYRTTSLISSDCTSCKISPAGAVKKDNSLVMDYGTLDCSRGINGGNGLVCKK